MDIGIFALLRDKKGKVLLVQDATRQHLWTLPGGGVDFQELIPESLEREVKEETSLDVVPERLIGIFSQQKTPGVAILMEVRTNSTEQPKPDGEETQSVGYFSFEEILNMREKVKPAQLSMVYQALCNPVWPIYNYFISPE